MNYRRFLIKCKLKLFRNHVIIKVDISTSSPASRHRWCEEKTRNWHDGVRVLHAVMPISEVLLLLRVGLKGDRVDQIEFNTIVEGHWESS